MYLYIYILYIYVTLVRNATQELVHLRALGIHFRRRSDVTVAQLDLKFFQQPAHQHIQCNIIIIIELFIKYTIAKYYV